MVMKVYHISTETVLTRSFGMRSRLNDSLFAADFQEAFQLFDQKGDGRVQVSQIGDILRALGQNPTESDVKKLTHNHRPGELCFCF